MLSTSVLAGVVTLKTEDGPAGGGGLVVSPSAVVAVASHVKLVGEAHWVAPSSRLWLWLTAVRVPYGPLAVDLGIAGLGASQGTAPIGSVSWRW
jgi:hypothetical protein